jgi:hypothetical protein
VPWPAVSDVTNVAERGVHRQSGRGWASRALESEAPAGSTSTGSEIGPTTRKTKAKRTPLVNRRGSSGGAVDERVHGGLRAGPKKEAFAGGERSERLIVDTS